MLVAMVAGAGWKVVESSSLAVSANNIRQLSAGGASYLADHNYYFWRYIDRPAPELSGVTWWFGYESTQSLAKPEGQRSFDPEFGPLGGYVPAGIRPDPSFRLGGKAFKPKYQSGYIGIGYNVLLGGGWRLDKAGDDKDNPYSYWSLTDPGKVVVFSTAAQINILQRPASPKNPMIEEFYGFDEGGPPWKNPPSIHFRHHGYAMVAYANGSAGLLPMEESTRDGSAPKANIGRFAPAGSTKYLLPE